MDRLDVRILRAYFQDRGRAPLNSSFRVPVAAIAKQVGGDENTVRYRLRKIRESGFITDWRLFLNPQLWGGGHISVWFDVDPAVSKRDVAERLRPVPGLTHVTTTYESVVAFLGYGDEASLSRLIGLVRHLVGVPEILVARDAFPPCDIALTAGDWDIIRALRKSPRKSYADLAREMGLSTRAAKARILRLSTEGVVFAWPSLDFHAVKGDVFVFLAVQYPGDRKVEIDGAITAHLEPYLWHMMHMLPYRSGDLWPCGYDLVVPNVAVVREILDWARGLPGVKWARTYLYENIFSFLDTYDRWLESELRRRPSRRAGLVDAPSGSRP